MSDLPKTVHIMEVGPRDGLQIEPKTLPAAEKVKMIAALADAGLPEIEVGSYVNPRAVPQMADSPEVIAGLTRRDGVQYRALWLNARGLERALAQTDKLDIDGKLTLTASETFIQRNTNRSIEDTFAQMPEWIALYRNAGIEASTLGLMAAFGCNFEGYIPEDKVLALIDRTAKVMADNGGRLRHLSLADTMGWGNPLQTKRLVGKVRDKFPDVEIKLHLHDTRGQAVANAVAAMELGVRVFDSAVGGLGGCPFAGHKGAAGNVCTEDLVFSCEEMGIDTGVDLEALVETARMVEDMVGHPLPGKVMKGGSLAKYKGQ